MRVSIRAVLLIFFVCARIFKSEGQGLEHIPPVLKGEEKYADTGVSFLTSVLDFHQSELKRPQKYFNCLQIFDADVSWPPRWYYAVPFASFDSVKQKMGFDAPGDLRYQHGFFTFSRAKAGGEKNKAFSGYIICNKKLEPVDTIKSSRNNIIDPHDLRINEKDERLIMVNLDTVLDIHLASGNPGDTMVAASVTVIEILDSTNKMIFRWNSAAVLGANTLYYPGVNTHTYFKQNHMDWSHATAALWDRDGNILYSFRYVGVGKISRQDGHVIWRIDRRDMPVIKGADTIEFYDQHDFTALGDTGEYDYYSLFSAGTWPDRWAGAMTFKVNKVSHEIKPVSKRLPDEPLISGGAGNYEVYENGDYLMNYGQYPLKDSSEKFHVFMKLCDKNERGLARYQLPALEFAYKVHAIKNERPPRPEVVQNKKTLRANGEMNEWNWYRLSGPDNTTVEKVGEGQSLTPLEEGWYCVEGKYGIGWSVSKPFLFNKSGGKAKGKNK